MKIFKILSGLIKENIKKFFSVIKDLWDNGIKDLFINKRYLKGMLDLILMIGWTFLLNAYSNTVFVSLFSIALIMSVLSRSFKLNDDTVANDVFGPFLSIFLYSISVYIFWWYLEIALLVGYFLLPNITNDIFNKYHEYTLKYVYGESI